MALSVSQITTAKAEAKEFLEYSTYTLCLVLGVDPDTVSTSYTVPVASDNALYEGHTCLKNQLAALAALE